MAKRIEKAFKSLLVKAGYSEKAKTEVWNWYTFPAEKGKATKKSALTVSSDF